MGWDWDVIIIVFFFMTTRIAEKRNEVFPINVSCNILL